MFLEFHDHTDFVNPCPEQTFYNLHKFADQPCLQFFFISKQLHCSYGFCMKHNHWLLYVLTLYIFSVNRALLLLTATESTGDNLGGW